mgnify:CR=1 FL=1
MLSVSKTAKAHLHHHLKRPHSAASEDKCFRIVPTAHDLFLTIKLARPKPDDKTYRYDGKTVLALPKSLQRVCRHRRLHIDDDGKLSLA